MNGFMLWAWIVSVGAGIFFGIFVGEDNKVRENQRTPLYERVVLKRADTNWFYAGLVAGLFSIVLGLIAANPPEKLVERADQIRFETTAEEDFGH